MCNKKKNMTTKSDHSQGIRTRQVSENQLIYTVFPFIEWE